MRVKKVWNKSAEHQKSHITGKDIEWNTHITFMGRYLSQVFDAFVFIRKHSDIFSEKIRVKLLFTLATNTNLTSPPK